MTQSHALVITLKRALKSQGYTYKDVAKYLALSEASVKRLFAAGDFSLSRLDQICGFLALDIADLVKMMEMNNRIVVELTEEQERELVSDVKLLLVSFLVINGWGFQDIVLQYNLAESETIGYLARLDKLRVIELLPHNRIKLMVSPRFSWRKDGPIQKFFAANLQADFLKSRFDQEGEFFAFLSGMLSARSMGYIKQKLEHLAVEFNEYNQADRYLPLQQRIGYSLFLATRPWRADIFDNLRKQR